MKVSKNEQGIALITAIFAILLATVIGFALYYSSMIAFTIAVNDRDNTEVFYLADAGVNHAVALLNKVPKSQFSAVLTAGTNSTPDSGDELSVPPSTGLWTTGESIPAGNATGGGVTNFGAGGVGRYWVAVKNDTAAGETATTDSNGILIITSTGAGRDGATATIEATVTNNSSSMPGFLANGDVIISNTTKIIGPNATMQINGNLNNSSSVCSEQKVSISGDGSNLDLSRTSTGPLCNQPGVLGTTVLVNQPKVTPPIIDTAKLRSDFRSKADFVFKGDGSIYQQVNGTPSTFALSSSELAALGLGSWTWSASSKTWSYSSSTAVADGTYYFENSNIKITNGGSPSTPPRLTLLSEGSISITNAPTFQPNLPGYSMVSANDISISSTLGSLGNPGLVYAYGQIEFTNKTNIYGGLVAANFYQSDGTNGPDALDAGGQNLVSRSSKGTVRFSNVVTITTVAGMGSGSGATINSWREVRY